jgi:hypothetical protein
MVFSLRRHAHPQQIKAGAERAVERLHLKMAVKDFEGARAAWKIAARAGFPPPFYHSVYLLY